VSVFHYNSNLTQYCCARSFMVVFIVYRASILVVAFQSYGWFAQTTFVVHFRFVFVFITVTSTFSLTIFCYCIREKNCCWLAQLQRWTKSKEAAIFCSLLPLTHQHFIIYEETSSSTVLLNIFCSHKMLFFNATRTLAGSRQYVAASTECLTNGQSFSVTQNLQFLIYSIW